MPDPDQDPGPGQITALLHEAAHGNREAFDRLFPLVYTELRQLAGRKLRFESPGHTLNATALVHEAYLRLVVERHADWRGRHQFFVVASEAMRRILVDHAKRRSAAKRAGGRRVVPLDEARAVAARASVLSDDEAADLIALDEALNRLAEFNPRGARVVQYRYFGGLSIEEICEAMNLSERTVRRAWTAARGWLRRELQDELEVVSTLLHSASPRDASRQSPDP